MKIVKQEKQGNTAVLEVEEDFDKLEPHLEAAYAEASRELNIPGFRQGKAPPEIVKKYIQQDAVIDRGIQLLMAEIYPSILDSSKLRPVDYPNIEVKKLEKGSPIIFDVKVEVYPEFKLGTYKGLKVIKKAAPVTEEDVNTTIDHIRKDYAAHNNVQESEIVLDDEFVKKVSRMSSLEELKGVIKANIEDERKSEADRATRDEVTKKLAEVIQADIPKGMIEREVELMIKDMELSLQRNKMTLNSYLSAVKKDMNKLKDDLKGGAEVRIKAKMALDTIIEKEKLLIEDKDLDAEIEALAQQAGKPKEDYKAGLSGDVLDYIKEYMLREKAIDFVISKAKVE